jgi:hypothetical protein
MTDGSIVMPDNHIVTRFLRVNMHLSFPATKTFWGPAPMTPGSLSRLPRLRLPVLFPAPETLAYGHADGLPVSDSHAIAHYCSHIYR